MNTRLVISLVIIGILIALAGIGLDYQRRLRHKEQLQAWRQAEAVRQAAQQRKSDADFAAMRQRLEGWTKSVADSAAKIEADSAAAREEAAARNLRQMRQASDAELQAARDEADKVRGL